MADLAPSENSVWYTINAIGLEGSTAGHIHYGIEAENRSVIVTLFKDYTSQYQVSESGGIAANNLTGPRVDTQFSDLIDEFDEDNAYAIIPTGQYPNGEIIGQIINLFQMNTEE